jgi:hypothetical protein
VAFFNKKPFSNMPVVWGYAKTVVKARKIMTPSP